MVGGNATAPATTVPVTLHPVAVDPFDVGVGLDATSAASAEPGLLITPPPPSTCPAPQLTVAVWLVAVTLATKVCVEPT
jgi:hypothetical protein